jgi:hypothetical protein
MASKKGLYIRLDAASEAKLRELAARNQASMGEVVSVAIEQLAGASSSTFATAKATREASKVGAAKRQDEIDEGGY